MIFKRFKLFPFFYQYDSHDCGPTALKMVAKYYGRNYSLNVLRNLSHINKTGISMEGLKLAAEIIGFDAMGVKVPFENVTGDSLKDVQLPFIAFWNNNHFVVVYKITKNSIYVADPASGRIKLKFAQFKKSWCLENTDEGILLMLMPNDQFNTLSVFESQKSTNVFSFLEKYFHPYYKYIGIIIASFFTGSMLLLLFPYLTKSMVDQGVNEKNIHFVYLILFGQLVLYFSQTSLSFIQRWLILHISSRINIELSTAFLKKIMSLPLSFFDNRNFGDLYQRINDHKKIESFFSASTLSVLFSLFNLLVFGGVLFVYSHLIFAIYITGSFLYFIWIFYFLKRRKKIEYEFFQEYAYNADLMFELIQGMQEIKLQNSEIKRTNKWIESQKRLLNINIRSTTITQYQDVGAFFINQIKNIVITVMAASAVIYGTMSLGMLIATQFIIGQLNGPLQQLVTFIGEGQSAQLSLKRIIEIHEMQEEDHDKEYDDLNHSQAQEDLMLKNVSFRYNGLDNFVLKNINLQIPKGKVTAIVGTSGSGKTTLIKLLLGFYQPTSGDVMLGNLSLSKIKSSDWRSQCGVVMQDGFIFSDSIANNIAESSTIVDYTKLNWAAKTANISDYIEELALKYNTKIGTHGNGLSQGQKQRILISRAVYKNPHFLFFDEATNSLDTKSEKIISENLQQFYKGKTVVIVAHRLSTVKNADQIIVLENGEAVEQGTHRDLILLKKNYYNLVKNQLELGA